MTRDEILASVNLRDADLRGADLRGANLSYVNLSYAYLTNANLRGANLSYAYLTNANLSYAYLTNANLRGANLSYANLRDANLRGANLYGADLRGAKNVPLLVAAQSSILPESGPVFGWKKCKYDVLVKIAVGSKAKRTSATGRKCRAEYVKVLEVIGAEAGISQHDSKTEYRVGQIVRCDKWEEDRWVECGGGIHFFLTRIEAENY